jgi:hypothetical protein
MTTRTQNVTDADVKKGQIRLPTKTVLQLGLKSQYVGAPKPSRRWAFGSRKETARFTDNGSRSGTIRLGKGTMESLVASRCIAVGEQLQITPADGAGEFHLSRHGAVDATGGGATGGGATGGASRSVAALLPDSGAPAGLPRVKRERSDAPSPSPRARKRPASASDGTQAGKSNGAQARRRLSGAALGSSQNMPTINSRVEMQFDDYAYSGTVTSQNFDTMSFGVVLDWEEEKWPEVKLGKHQWKLLQGEGGRTFGIVSRGNDCDAEEDSEDDRPLSLSEAPADGESTAATGALAMAAAAAAAAPVPAASRAAPTAAPRAAPRAAPAAAPAAASGGGAAAHLVVMAEPTPAARPGLVDRCPRGDIASWLRSLGASDSWAAAVGGYISSFENEEMTLDVIQNPDSMLDHCMLEKLGVEKMGHRVRILSAWKRLISPAGA